MGRSFYYWCFIIIIIGVKDNAFCGLFLTEQKNSKDWSLCAVVPPFTRSDTGSTLSPPHGPQRQSQLRRAVWRGRRSPAWRKVSPRLRQRSAHLPTTPLLLTVGRSPVAAFLWLHSFHLQTHLPVTSPAVFCTSSDIWENLLSSFIAPES